MENTTTNNSILSRIPQTKLFHTTTTNGDRVRAIVSYGDECKNGHNTFSITGNVWYKEFDAIERTKRDRAERARDGDAGGCIHEDIARAMPYLAPFIKWHLTSTDGPMHYIANTLYLADDADHNGKRVGEPTRFDHFVRFNGSRVGHMVKPAFARFLQSKLDEPNCAVDLVIVKLEHVNKDGETFQYAPKYTFKGFGTKWHEGPFDELSTAQDWKHAMYHEAVSITAQPTVWSDGKERQLDAARSAAVWPDATDEILKQPRALLSTVLSERLPALMAEFRTAVESFGFTY